MIAVLAVNLAAVALAIVLPNDFLRWNSYVLYGVQLVTILPYLARRAYFTKNLFIPTLFVVAYYLISLTLGSYLVPRGFGWNKDFAPVALGISAYNIIVPYLMLANIALFVLACATIRELADVEPDERESDTHRILNVPVQLLLVGAFVVLTYGGVYSAFSFQLVILTAHVTYLARRRTKFRLLVYAAYLLILLGVSFENKREIVMALFLIMFLESYYSRSVLRAGLRSMAKYVAAGACFLLLILAASVLRGYGAFENVTPLDAIAYVPRYIGSDLFIDGVTDNLELNYHYGSAIAAIDLANRGELPFQFGASLWKVFFLPVPRSAFPAKPESVMQLFTQTFAPGLWANEGSLPVMFAAEMYVNFSIFGLLPLVLVWFAIDRIFVAFHRAAPGSFRYYSCAFLVITVLMLARGSGIEQWTLYYLIALPLILVAVLPRAATARRLRMAMANRLEHA